MLNIVAVMGRLVADPTMRQTTTGKMVASFRIAVDRGRRDASGQSQADFFDVVAWDKRAEFVEKYFRKGSMIAIAGRLQSRQYQDKSGANRTAIEIVATDVNFSGEKFSGEKKENRSGYQSTPGNMPPEPVSYESGSNDDFAVIDDSEDFPF